MESDGCFGYFRDPNSSCESGHRLMIGNRSHESPFSSWGLNTPLCRSVPSVVQALGTRENINHRGHRGHRGISDFVIWNQMDASVISAIRIPRANQVRESRSGTAAMKVHSLLGGRIHLCVTLCPLWFKLLEPAKTLTTEDSGVTDGFLIL